MSGSDQRSYFVTGASSGLGEAIAVRLAEQGARVAVNYAANKDGAERVAKACKEAGGDALVVQGDVSIEDDCRRMAEAVSDWGRIDGLANNAGVTRHGVALGDLEGVQGEDFLDVYNVNLVGAFQMIRALRPMLEATHEQTGKAASVLNVSSTAGLNGVGSSLPYLASKGALNMMTLAMARTLAPKIRVNAICPGYLSTPWFEKGLGEEAAKGVHAMMANLAPLKDAPSGDDAAALAVFLMGRESTFMTGELVGLDAGMRLLSPLAGGA